jgi:hypothetical protein
MSTPTSRMRVMVSVVRPGTTLAGDGLGVWNRVGEEPEANPGEGGGLGPRSKTGPRYGVQPNHANARHERRNEQEGNGARTHLATEGFLKLSPLGGQTQRRLRRIQRCL